MLCNMCNKRDAVLLVQQVSSEEKKEIHLCPTCARERGIGVAGDKIPSSIKTLIDAISLPQNGCYVCGRTFDDIEKTGQLGCPECYISFQNEIKGILKNKGIDAPYTGSMPKKLEHFRSILTDRIEIQKKLDISIAEEDYEKAAMYRDFLNSLERPAIANANEEGGLFDK